MSAGYGLTRREASGAAWIGLSAGTGGYGYGLSGWAASGGAEGGLASQAGSGAGRHVSGGARSGLFRRWNGLMWHVSRCGEGKSRPGAARRSAGYGWGCQGRGAACTGSGEGWAVAARGGGGSSARHVMARGGQSQVRADRAWLVKSGGRRGRVRSGMSGPEWAREGTGSRQGMVRLVWGWFVRGGGEGPGLDCQRAGLRRNGSAGQRGMEGNGRSAGLDWGRFGVAGHRVGWVRHGTSAGRRGWGMSVGARGRGESVTGQARSRPGMSQGVGQQRCGSACHGARAGVGVAGR